MPTLDTAMSKLNFSRRHFIMFLAAATAAAATSNAHEAQAQADLWQEYRRDDLGFRIEMPSKPTITEDKGLPRENLIRSFDADIEVERVSFGVSHVTYKSVSAEQVINSFRQGISVIGDAITEKSITMNGLPAYEFTVAPGIGDGAYYRMVFVGNAVITIQAVGGSIGDPRIRRFVDSFRLLTSTK